MRNEFWIISTLISIGVIGGFIYNWPVATDEGAARQFPTSEPTTTEDADLPSPDSTGSNQPEQQRQRLIELGDEYLEIGNYEDALDYFLAVYKSRKDDVTLTIRVGIAYELNQQYNHADFFFRRALQSKQANSEQRLVTLLAQARNWQNLGRENEAIEFLCDQFLSIDGDKQLTKELKFRISSELSRLFELQASILFEEKTSVLSRPYFLDCPASIQATLNIIDKPEIAKVDFSAKDVSVSPNGQLDIRLLQRPNDDVNLTVLSGTTTSVSVAKLISVLEKKTDVSFVISPEIQPYLIGRTIKLQSNAISLAGLLDAVFRPLSLVWTQTGTEIKLLPASKLSQQALAKHRAQQAIRIGRQIIVNYPDSNCRDSIRLAGANFHFLIEEFDAASTILNQLKDEKPTGELNAMVRLNLGILETRFGRYRPAIEQLMGAVDQTVDNEIKAIAYANIARINIKQANIDPAIIASSRCLSLTGNPAIRSAAAMDMARGYLINREPESANRALFENARTFSDGVDKKLALVFGAYARSLGTLSPIPKHRAIETLVIALADVDPSQLTNPVDRILIAKAYLNIGLPDKAVTVLQGPAKNLTISVWERKRMFELAQMLKITGQKNESRSYFRNVAEELEDDIGKRALLELAMIELLDRKSPDKCLKLCQRLWEHELTEYFKNSALRLMGRAYMDKGDADSAAYCFAGVLPGSNANNTTFSSSDKQ